MNARQLSGVNLFAHPWFTLSISISGAGSILLITGFFNSIYTVATCLVDQSLALFLFPPLSGWLRRSPDICLAALLVGISAGTAGAIAGHQHGIRVPQAIWVGMITESVLLTQASGLVCLRRFGLPQPIALTATIAATSAWLLWPTYLNAAPPQVVVIHPLLAMNGVLADLGIWTEQPVF